jgi:hypothetical protein
MRPSRTLLGMIAIIVFPVSVYAQTVNLFGNAIPGTLVVNDPNAVTLGIKFWARVPGTISGIRFYRGHRNGNGYNVRLYTAAGSQLGRASTKTDTCAVPCWESISFAAPISISPNTTYIAAYYTSNGEYAANDTGLVNGVANGSLVAPASNMVGGNGVYTYSTGFPNLTYEESNYWVDVEFTPSAPPPPVLQLSFNPPNPTVAPSAPIGTLITTAVATWSDGSQFVGTYSFGSPYANDGGLVMLSNGQILVNGDLAGLMDTNQQVSVTATQ